MNSFIEQEIERSNRRLLIINVGILCFLALYCISQARYLGSFLRGAQPVSASDLVGLDPASHQFVSFTSPNVHNTGLKLVERQEGSKRETVLEQYLVAQVGDKLIVVKARPDFSGSDFSGAVEPISDDVQSRLVGPMLSKQPELKAYLLPFVLDTKDYKNQGWWSLALGIPLLLLALWNLARWFKRREDVMEHPIMKRLAQFGPAVMMQHEIDAEMQDAGVQKIGNATLTRSWLVARTFGMQFVKLDYIVWVYKKVTRHRVNFVPVGKTYDVQVNDRTGKTITINGAEKNVDGLLMTLAQRMPWIIGGFSSEVSQLWLKKRSDLVATVDSRRKQFNAKTAVAAAAGD